MRRRFPSLSALPFRSERRAPFACVPAIAACLAALCPTSSKAADGVLETRVTVGYQWATAPSTQEASWGAGGFVVPFARAFEFSLFVGAGGGVGHLRNATFPTGLVFGSVRLGYRLDWGSIVPWVDVGVTPWLLASFPSSLAFTVTPDVRFALALRLEPHLQLSVGGGYALELLDRATLGDRITAFVDLRWGKAIPVRQASSARVPDTTLPACHNAVWCTRAEF